MSYSILYWIMIERASRSFSLTQDCFIFLNNRYIYWMFDLINYFHNLTPNTTWHSEHVKFLLRLILSCLKLKRIEIFVASSAVNCFLISEDLVVPEYINGVHFRDIPSFIMLINKIALPTLHCVIMFPHYCITVLAHKLR